MVSPYLLRPLRSLSEVRRRRDSRPPTFTAAEGADDRSPGADPADDGAPGTDPEASPEGPALGVRPSSFPPARG